MKLNNKRLHQLKNIFRLRVELFKRKSMEILNGNYYYKKILSTKYHSNKNEYKRVKLTHESQNVTQSFVLF